MFPLTDETKKIAFIVHTVCKGNGFISDMETLIKFSFAVREKIINFVASMKLKTKLMDWLHIIAVIALIVIGVVIYFNKRQ